MTGTRGMAAPLGALGIILMGACGATTSPGGGTSACTGAVSVASDLPTGGSDASDGVPTENGARLAVNQAMASRALGGCTLTFIPKNDSSVALGKHDPNQGAANLTELAGNQSVVGVVGPFNSSVGKAEAPIANNAGLTLISPANTNPGLTIEGSNPDINTASLRPTGTITYFRVCTTDIGQGRALAQAATDTLKVKKAFVIDDQETYGKGLADQFLKYFIQAGGTKVDRVSEPSKKDYRDDLNKARQDGADFVFFGGTSSNGGGIVRKDEATILPNAQYLGGDGIVDGEFFTEAGAAGNGAYGTIAAPDPTRLDTARQFVTDYRSAFNADPGPYSANAYDAMNIIIQSIRRAIDANKGTLPADPRSLRAAVRANVAAISYDGAIGHTSFDRNGDTTNVLLTLDRGEGGKWVFNQTIQLKGV